VRGVLRELAHEAGGDQAQTDTDAREFGAELHRRLAAAGEPPAFGWLARLREAVTRARPVLTGAVVGALVTATAFMLLGARPPRDAETTVDRSASAPEVIEATPAQVTGRTSRPPGGRAVRTMGDRHVTRDRMGDDIGAERPERSHGRDRR
jgi:hypothetical protein